jgi:hypothetical protein
MIRKRKQVSEAFKQAGSFGLRVAMTGPASEQRWLSPSWDPPRLTPVPWLNRRDERKGRKLDSLCPIHSLSSGSTSSFGLPFALSEPFYILILIVIIREDPV